MAKPPKKLKVQPGDVVAVTWLDHVGIKNMPLVPGSIRLVELVTYGEVLSLDAEVLELIQEKHTTEGGDANDACGLGMGLVKKVTVYRPVGEAELPE